MGLPNPIFSTKQAIGAMVADTQKDIDVSISAVFGLQVVDNLLLKMKHSANRIKEVESRQHLESLGNESFKVNPKGSFSKDSQSIFQTIAMIYRQHFENTVFDK